MKRKFVSACIGIMTMCMTMLPGVMVNAAEKSESEGWRMVSVESSIDIPDEVYEGRVTAGNETKGIFSTKYRVSVKKATMRSGPGTSYSSLGTLYKDDVVWVKSISNGWAKFMGNSKWHYISTSCIKKDAR